MTAIFQKILVYFELAPPKQLWRILIVTALLAGMCTLNRGLQSDDYIHRQMLLDQESSFNTKINSFFEFLEPNETLAWWTHPELKIKFWRPLSATSHWLDYQWWPNSPRLMHLHNSLWYVLIVCLSFLFFKRLFTKQAPAFLAAIIFCIDFSHFANVSWIANRNSLIASTFILSSLIFYLDWKKSQRLSNLLLSGATFIFALLSAESSIILLSVVFVYEILFFTKNKTPSLTTLFNKFVIAGPLTFFLIAGCWFSYYHSAGFGSANNSMYFNPSDDFLFSFKLIASKIPVFMFGNIFGIEGFYNVFSPDAKIIISFFCGFSVFILLFLTRNALNNINFLFLFIATLIALIPISFVGIVDMRLGIYASIFSSGLLSIIFTELYFDNKKSIGKTLIFFGLIVSHLIISPAQWIHVGLKDWQQEKISFSPLKRLKNQYPENTIFVFNYPSPIDAYYFPFAHQTNSHPVYVVNNNLSNYQLEAITSDKVVAISDYGFVFTESDFDKLKIEKPVRNGIYARAAFNGMLPRHFQFKQGDSFENKDFSVEILELTKAGLVKTMRFSFHDIETNNNNDKLFFLWNSENKNFDALFLEDSFNKKPLLRINNW